MESLIAAKTNLNCQNDDGNTALHLAIKQSDKPNHQKIAFLLIKAGADATLPNNEKMTAFDLASSKNNAAMLKDMITKKMTGGNLPETWAKHHVAGNMLDQMILNGEKDENLNQLKTLLNAKADVNTAISNGSLPLHAAARLGSCAILKLLLDAKANIHATNRSNSTPLIEACTMEKTAAINLLLNAGANPLVVDNLNKHPIDYLPEGHETIALLKEKSIRTAFPEWFAKSYLERKCLPLSTPEIETENELEKKAEQLPPKIVEPIKANLAIKPEAAPNPEPLKPIENEKAKLSLETEQTTSHKEVKKMQQLTQSKPKTLFKKVRNRIIPDSTVDKNKGYQL